MNSALRRVASITDTLEHFWEQRVMKRTAGSILALVYLFAIGLIELNRNGLLPDFLADELPTNHFFAVEIAFTVLLFTEVISLVFGLTRSFSRSIGIQLEILSLIFLRDTFKQFTTFSEPIVWSEAQDGIQTMIVDSLGALFMFILIALYYRSQRSRPITEDPTDQEQFIAVKKVIALGLLGVFATIGLVDIVRIFQDGDLIPFFETFYTVLILTDVLMVLISLRYGTSFDVTFRNFGYSVVTVFIRLALIAPTLEGVLIGVGTTLFALGLTVAYNTSTQLGTQEANISPNAAPEPAK